MSSFQSHQVGPQGIRHVLKTIRNCLKGAASLECLPIRPVDGRYVANDAPAVFLIRDGAVLLKQKGISSMLQPGQALLIPPRSGYRMVAQGLPARIFSIMPHGGAIACNSLDCDGKTIAPSRGSTLVPDSGEVALLLQALTVWPTDDPTGRSLAMRTTFHALLRALSSRARFVGGGTTLLARVQDLLAEQFTDPDCSATSLARLLDCHPDHLARVFRKREGQTLREAVTILRLRHARTLLLEERDTTIGDIAQRCGFRNGQRLSEHFRASFGITPSELRRQAHTY